MITQVKNEKDLGTTIKVFEKQVKNFLHLDLEVKLILKQNEMKLIQKIEVFNIRYITILLIQNLYR